MELMTLLGQTVLVGLLAGWLTLAALENIRAPSVNRDLVAAVLSMETMGRAWPEIYEVFKRNRITDPRVHGCVFATIVAVESITALVLIGATLALVGAVLGLVGVDAARIIACAGTLGFTAIWGMFLIGGQWAHYWVGHEGAQATHFMLTLWGIGTYLALV